MYRYRSIYIHLLLISLLTVAAYANSFGVPFQYDDSLNIVKNQYIKDIAYLTDFSTPEEFGMLFKTRYIGYLSFAINYAVHGLRPFGFHLINTLIHIANALLLYFLVVLMFRTPALRESRVREHAPMIALLSALVFALHPLQTQAVTYIVQRFASMAAMFYLAAVVCYIKFRLGRRSAWYAAAMVSVVLGMFTKEVTITLPLMLVLVEAVFFEGGIKKRALTLLPFMFTVLIIPTVMLYVRTGGDLSGLFRATRESIKLQTDMGRLEYLFTQFGVLLKYMRLMILPYGQNLDHYHPVEHVFMSVSVLVPLLLHMLIAGAAGYAYIKSMRGMLDPVFKAVAFGVLWFYLASSVESGLVPIMDVINEHRVYLPGTGLIISMALLATMGLNYYNREIFAKGLLVLCLGSVFVLLPLTVMRNTVWQSPMSLWADVVSKSPQSPRARHNLGQAFYDTGKYTSAAREFEIATNLRPSQRQSYVGLSNCYSALGNTEMSRKYSEMARYVASVPVDYYLERGSRYLDKGMYDKALEEYQMALDMSPDNAAVLFNLGLVYFKMGMYDKALSYLTRARRLNPGYVDTYRLMGDMYLITGRSDQAREAYSAGLDAAPLDSILNSRFGLLVGKAGEYELALKHLERAAELDHGNIEAYMGLGNVMFITGDLDAAISSFKKVVELEPGNSQAHYNLAIVYARLGRTGESESHMSTYRGLAGLK